MGSIYFNGSELTGQHDVNFNGVAMDNVYLNTVKLWTRHPYALDTDIFTFSWSNGGSVTALRGSYYSTYPLAFASQPSYDSGDGSPDTVVRMSLADGFYVSSYSNDSNGTDSDGTGASNTGETHFVWLGSTVTGMYGGTGFSIGASGNGGSSFTVTYSGQ